MRLGESVMRGVIFKAENNEIVLKKKLSKNETYKLNNRDKTCVLVIYKKLEEAIGVTSLCENGKHIIMIDWDNICQWIAERDITRIIKEDKLSPFYFFCSKEKKIDGETIGNYHTYSLTQKYPAGIVEIQRKTHCDRAYVTMPLRSPFRSWCIRTSEKKGRNRPKFLKIIGDKNLDNEVSEAHLNLLTKLYNIPKLKYTNLDGSKILFKNVYKTGNF